ncbi:HDIG domain-containing protein, partial [Dysgonomonas sp. OttesenSCG-928-M03]|nr:HDIG domain-containing protein [Dysgonomonas sp. OttesenSCG-928-M03]
FTENQLPGMNPHKGLPYKESARIIISHVTEGVKIAKKYNLPQQIIDFIETHHGMGKVKYFYNSYVNEHPDEVVDPSDFTYPGPNPFSKETAILMMADTVEAASRSLQEYTEENISNLVEKLIDSQLKDGLLRNAPITFRDIDIAKGIFKDKLKTIYHSRIVYPELSEEAQKNAENELPAERASENG